MEKSRHYTGVKTLGSSLGAYARFSEAGKVSATFYLDLWRELQKHQVQYVMVGGIAINRHGVDIGQCGAEKSQRSASSARVDR